MVTMWINAPIVIYSKETDNTNTNKYQVSKKKVQMFFRVKNYFETNSRTPSQFLGGM